MFTDPGLSEDAVDALVHFLFFSSQSSPWVTSALASLPPRGQPHLQFYQHPASQSPRTSKQRDLTRMLAVDQMMQPFDTQGWVDVHALLRSLAREKDFAHAVTQLVPLVTTMFQKSVGFLENGEWRELFLLLFLLLELALCFCYLELYAYSDYYLLKVRFVGGVHSR